VWTGDSLDRISLEAGLLCVEETSPDLASWLFEPSSLGVFAMENDRIAVSAKEFAG